MNKVGVREKNYCPFNTPHLQCDSCFSKKKKDFTCFNESLFKLSNNVFYFSLKSILRYLDFCPDSFSQVGKQLEKKANFNFNTYGVIEWKINNRNICIALYLCNQVGVYLIQKYNNYEEMVKNYIKI